MKRFTTTILNFLSVCSLFFAMALPLAAQTEPNVTDDYIHFTGHGKYVLNVDDSGKLSAFKQKDSTAAPAGGLSWSLIGDDTNGYVVKSGTHYYIQYKNEEFVTTQVETDATKFEKKKIRWRISHEWWYPIQFGH